MTFMRYMGVGVLLGAILLAVVQLSFGDVFPFDVSRSSANEQPKMSVSDVNDGRDDTLTNTEGTNAPEIIVDEDKLDEIPKPEAQEQDFEELDAQTGDKEPAPEELPATVNLDIPFFAQAPEGNRTLPWKEACEEASIALAAHYLVDKELTLEEFKQDILDMVELQKQLFGDYVDTTVEETARLYEEYYGIGSTKIIDNPTIEDIKTELAQGHPVVAPFAGRELKNSHFTNGGPRYHMLVIKGYDDQYFYTNDVGTRFWKDFPYAHDVLMNALHDLTEGDITTGEKRILVIVQ